MTLDEVDIAHLRLQAVKIATKADPQQVRENPVATVKVAEILANFIINGKTDK